MRLRIAVQAPSDGDGGAEYRGVAPFPFNFRLERVRALREREEDLAKERLAASMDEQRRGEDLLRAAHSAMDGARTAQRHAAADAISGLDLLAAQAYLERTERRREAAALDLD